jgi:uncharacterized ferritin-like protein (DUF455 family)
MEMREWAIRILSADTLDEKLFDPIHLTDNEPGPALFWKEPSRPLNMGFHKHKTKHKLPKLAELHHPDKRAACLHRFAGHELLAVEIMAFALLAFPESPKHFRRGVANTLREEQGHVKLYIERMESFGIKFGDLPLYRHFWSYTSFIHSPLHYISIMSLTFEMANLDFAPMYGATFSQFGDEKSANLMKKILEDEIGHVSFGMNWLKKLKDSEKSPWQTWLESIPPKMEIQRARGLVLIEENHQLAGVPQDWIEQLKGSSYTKYHK